MRDDGFVVSRSFASTRPATVHPTSRMQRAIDYPFYVPGPPPQPGAQAIANARWLLAFRAALGRGKTDREAYDEANAAVPEALEPTQDEHESAAPQRAFELAEPYPWLVPAVRHGVRERTRDPRVHELWMPFGAEAIADWPGCSAFRAELAGEQGLAKFASASSSRGEQAEIIERARGIPVPRAVPRF